MNFDGFPAYKVMEYRRPNLHSTYVGALDVSWKPGEMKIAECRLMSWEGPCEGFGVCDHGIYGGYSFAQVASDYLWTESRLVALVELFGNILLGTSAARAEKGRLHSILTAPEELLEASLSNRVVTSQYPGLCAIATRWTHTNSLPLAEVREAVLERQRDWLGPEWNPPQLSMPRAFKALAFSQNWVVRDGYFVYLP